MLNFIALLLSIIFGGLTLIVDFPNVQLPGFPQVKFVQDDVLNFTGGPLRSGGAWGWKIHGVTGCKQMLLILSL